MRIINSLSMFFILAIFTFSAEAQDRPFLFTLTSPELSEGSSFINYGSAFGKETFEPFGGDGIEQNLGLKANLGKSVAFYGNVGMAYDKKSAASQQGEVIAHIMKAQNHFLDISLGAGMRHEYGDTDVLLSRFVIGRRLMTWQSYCNLLMEKPLSSDRDKIDLITTAGFSYTLSRTVRLGIEMVGQDLEGFWEEDEAEGGARLFVGPTMGIIFPKMHCSLTFGGGAIFQATRNNRINQAIRDLPTHNENGFIVRTMLNYGI